VLIYIIVGIEHVFNDIFLKHLINGLLPIDFLILLE